jgi:hypothetical protein
MSIESLFILLKKAQAVVQKTSRQNVTSTVFILLKKAQAVVQKTSRQNVTSTVWIFSSCLSFDGCHVWKNHNQLKRAALK